MVAICSTIVALVFAFIVGSALVGLYGNITRVVALLCVFTLILFITVYALIQGVPFVSGDNLHYPQFEIVWRNVLPVTFAIITVIVLVTSIVMAWARSNQTIYTYETLPLHSVVDARNIKYAVLDEHGEVIGMANGESVHAMLSHRSNCTCRLWNDLDEARIGV